MEARRPKRNPPLLAPNHQRNDREEEYEQHSSEREPGPEIAHLCRERQCKVPDDETYTAREIEEYA